MTLRSRQLMIAALLATQLWSGAILAAEKKEISADHKQIIVSDAGFATPESIEYYPAEDVYLVTNINGSGVAADGNGFISKVKPDGSVEDLKWLDGEKPGFTLNAPKGAAIVGNKLYVADLNQVHIFELPGGKQKPSVTIEGSTFLNGITPGHGDFVYVTDSGLTAGKEGMAPSGTDAIYKVWANGKYETIVKDKNMGHPNGIFVDGKQIMVVTFGSGEVFRIDKKGKRHALPKPPKEGLDGLLIVDDGRIFISSWGASGIYELNSNNTYSVFSGSLDAPADMGFDSKRKRLLVPLFNENKLVFLTL